MKKSILAGLVALVFCGSAFAQNNWTISGNTLLTSDQLSVAISKAEINHNSVAAISKEIVKEYRKAGYLSAQVAIDAQNHRILISEKPAKITGKYARYFRAGHVLTADKLNNAAARMTAEAAASNEKVNINFENTAQGVVLDASGQPNNSNKWGGSASYSNLGQRYSSADVINGYAFVNAGHGVRLDAGYTLGLPNVRDDSKGGAYRSVNAKISQSSFIGTFAGSVQDTHYKTGGDSLWLGQNGDITITALSHEYQLTTDLSLKNSLNHVDQDLYLDAIGIEDHQKYNSWLTTLGYKSPKNWGVSGTFEKGISGSNDYDLIPVFSSFNPHFSRFELEAWQKLDLKNDWQLVNSLGFQTASENTPSAAQWIIGGMERGRSYNAGFISGADGAFASTTLYAPSIKNMVRPYFGLDAAFVQPNSGGREDAKSAFVGAKAQAGKHVFADLSYARGLGNQPEHATDRNKILFTISAVY